MVEESKLSPEEQAALRERAELRKKESKYAKVEPGEKKMFVFDILKVKQVHDRFDSEGTKTRTQYKVIEPSMDLIGRSYEVTNGQAEKIDKLLAQGKTNIWCENHSEVKFTTIKPAES